jgi:hypothetical protein
MALAQVESKKASLREFAARMRVFFGQREWAEVFDPLWAIASYVSEPDEREAITSLPGLHGEPCAVGFHGVSHRGEKAVWDGDRAHGLPPPGQSGPAGISKVGSLHPPLTPCDAAEAGPLVPMVRRGDGALAVATRILRLVAASYLLEHGGVGPLIRQRGGRVRGRPPAPATRRGRVG